MSHATTDDFDLHMDALDVDARVFRDAGDDKIGRAHV